MLCFRKCRAQRKSPISIPVANILDLDGEETTKRNNPTIAFFFFFLNLILCDSTLVN